MTHKSLSILFFLLCSVNMGAQQTYDLPLAKPVTTDTEKVTGEGARKNITGVVKPSIQVFLPPADKANGCAVILCPGGGMRALSWGSDVEQMATFLNERGIAAIGLKYHLNAGGSFPRGMQMPPMVDVTHATCF